MGIFLSILVAFAESAKNIFIKKEAGLSRSIVIIWGWQVFSLLVLIPALLFAGVPELNTTFWYASSVKILLYVVSLFLYAGALKRADLSLAIPMLAFTPLFTAFISYFLNGETPSTTGFFGILLIMAGAYLLNFNRGERNIFKPLVYIVKNKGTLLMLIVSFIWGITSSLDKTAVVNSEPLFYGAYVAIIMSLLLTTVLYFRHKQEIKRLFNRARVRSLAPIGILDGVVILLQMVAVSLTVTAYVIAIKRSSLLFTSLLAYVFFKEKIRGRILAIAIMFAGVVLIVIS